MGILIFLICLYPSYKLIQWIGYKCFSKKRDDEKFSDNVDRLFSTLTLGIIFYTLFFLFCLSFFGTWSVADSVTYGTIMKVEKHGILFETVELTLVYSDDSSNTAIERKLSASSKDYNRIVNMLGDRVAVRHQDWGWLPSYKGDSNSYVVKIRERY